MTRELPLQLRVGCLAALDFNAAMLEKEPVTGQGVDLASTAWLIACVRWVAVALSGVEVLLSTRPAPLSVGAVVIATAAMAIYNLPLSAAKWLPSKAVDPLLAVSLVGDFLVCSAWLALSLNDPYQASWVVYALVAIEAAVLYGWSGSLGFMAAFAVIYSALDWVQGQYFGPPFRLDSYVFNLTVVLLVAVFTAALGAQSHGRRRRSEASAEQAARHAERSQALYVVASRIAATLKREYVLDTVMDSLAALYPDRWHGILLRHESGRLELAFARGLPEHPQFPDSAAEFASLEEEAMVIGDRRSDKRAAGLLPVELAAYSSAAALQLRAPGRNFGVLLSLDPAKAAFDENEVRFLAALAHQTSTALENARLYEEVELMSLTDATTALMNRRAFDRRLAEELARAQRHDLPLALLMLDVDRFKLYNDEHGHPAGDRLLRRLGRILAANALRHSDLPFRFGGEEFAVIMPHTTAEEALKLARRLCNEVSEAGIAHPQNKPYGRLTVSVGVAGFPDDGQTESELVYRADVALYAAKRAGRNRVASANGRLVLPADAAAGTVAG